MTDDPTESTVTTDMLEMAERLRRVIGGFVRVVRAHADTPSSAQSETLGLLEREGPMSIAALAERRNVRHQSMRLVVAQLETDGLVGLKHDPADRRSKLVAITRKGGAAVVRGRQARAAWIARALQDNFTQQERQTLNSAVDALERLIKAAP
jgi:DNA-binding MarR family transcriptional regulator